VVCPCWDLSAMVAGTGLAHQLAWSEAYECRTRTDG